MNWLWSLLIYFIGVGIGYMIWDKRAYRRGLRDGQLKAMLDEVTREGNHDRTSRHSRVE